MGLQKILYQSIYSTHLNKTKLHQLIEAQIKDNSNMHNWTRNVKMNKN